MITAAMGVIMASFFFAVPFIMHAIKVFDINNDLEMPEDEDNMEECERRPNDKLQLPFDPNETTDGVLIEMDGANVHTDAQTEKKTAFV